MNSVLANRRLASADFCTLGYQPNPPVERERLPAAPHFAR